MPLHDYECSKCKKVVELLDPTPEELQCCKHTMVCVFLQAPAQFSKIIPTYPGSRRHKAGYQHRYVNRPASKTQVGVGGGVTKGDD